MLFLEFETNAVHIGEEPNLEGKGASGDVVVPIHLSSTFARKEAGKPTNGYEYSRTGNPTRNALEQKLATLEGAKHGLAFSSGMAATTTLALSLLKSGDHIAASDDLYGGTRRLFEKVFAEKFGISITYVDATDASNLKAALTPRTKFVWLETPSNPLLKICDIKAISEIAHERNAPAAHERSVLVVVDSTFASPYLQQPLSLGADIVLHSTTKYINGHSDSVGGAIMVSDAALHSQLRFMQNAAGAILSPFDSYLTLRGIKTLAVRMEKHSQNAQKIAEYLSNQSSVSRVIYHGLASHPQHKLAKKQMRGFGGMLSFEIKGGESAAMQFLSNLRLFSLAESLGGVESLIEHPASMTHASISAEERAKTGISGSLIRVSAGIEHAGDLIADLEQALAKTS